MNQPKPVSEIMQGVDLDLKSRVKEIMSVGDGIPQHKPSKAGDPDPNPVTPRRQSLLPTNLGMVRAGHPPYVHPNRAELHAQLLARLSSTQQHRDPAVELSVDRPPVWKSLSDVTMYVAIAYRIGIACTTQQDVEELCGDRGSEIYVPGEGEGEVTELFNNKELTRAESFARTILLVPNSNVGMFPLSMAMYRELKAEAQRNALTRAATAIREMDKQLQNATI